MTQPLWAAEPGEEPRLGAVPTLSLLICFHSALSPVFRQPDPGVGAPCNSLVLTSKAGAGRQHREGSHGFLPEVTSQGQTEEHGCSEATPESLRAWVPFWTRESP